MQSSNNEAKFFSQRLNLKMGEIVAKHYPYKDSSDYFIKLFENLKKNKFCNLFIFL